ncbi:unnamed protein product [Danaus chrysippus]|uniref:(African queen) hypothetical protein n=1 Tax=Danaus chrysippus TaxID=151541 RepID=A0A8J2VUW0_9NEOP|nr:unnamed protein product [Danaus chrysippus]
MESSAGEEDDEEVYFENNRQLLADLEDEEFVEDMDIPVESSTVDPPLIFDNHNDPILENLSETPQPSDQRNGTARPRQSRVTWRRTNLTTIDDIQNFYQLQYPDSMLELETLYNFFLSFSLKN